MSEEEKMISEQIIKREKKDTVIAYLLIVILIGAIIFILYLKFVKKDTLNEASEEYQVNYLTLSELGNSINNTAIFNTLKSGKLAANVNDDIMMLTYTEGEKVLNYSVPLINNELEFSIDENNLTISEEIYKKLIAAVCTYYNHDETGCENISTRVNNSSQIDGVRFLNDDIIYISMTSIFNPALEEEETVYEEETITDINNTDYELSFNGVTINDIKIEMLDTEIIISGSILSSKEASEKLNVKLYDEGGILLEEKTEEVKDVFSISFQYNDNLNIDTIKKYSINVE